MGVWEVASKYTISKIATIHYDDYHDDITINQWISLPTEELRYIQYRVSLFFCFKTTSWGGLSNALMHWQLRNTHYKINIIHQFTGFLDMIAWCEGAASEKLMSRKILFYKAIKLQKYKMHSACIYHPRLCKVRM